jgi:hypothetical protein
MDPKTKRKPIPAGGQPTPAAIDAANATPAADMAPAADNASAPPPAEVDTTDFVEARVLVAFDEYEVDDIISAPAIAIEQLQLAGRVDPHPDAVDFAKSLLED